MENQYYNMFISFLVKHSLYDEYNFNYIWNKAAFVEFEGDYSFLLGGCANIIDKHNNLQDIIPCLPNLVNSKSVAIGIYGYVQALLQVPKLNQKYKTNVYYTYILPIFYEKLFILENPTNELLEYENHMRKYLLENDSFNYKLVLDTVDKLIEDYKSNKLDDKKVARKARRISKVYLNMGNKNSFVI